MKNFYIKTLGCKTNQIESDLMAEHLENINLIKVDDILDADIFILNSCSVTSNADNDAIRILKKVKKDNSNIKTILTGCFAQLESNDLKKYDFIDLVLGNSEKLNIEKYIDKISGIEVADIFAQDEFIYKQVEKPTKTRAYLKIQDGCNNRCSYCTIWKARGKSRSCSIENILEQIKVYSEHDFQEVVLTGIHIGQWGTDLLPKRKFMELIETIEYSDIKRFRLGSLNPFELTDELINHLSKSEKFCPHFHMSLQSACNKTLKAMNRYYSVEHYLEQIDMINDKFNLPFISSDIIVGFPDETDEDFKITCDNITHSGLTMAHVFPYSIRKNTIAAEMKNQVPQQIKNQRANILRNIVSQKYDEFLNKNLNSIQEVLFQKSPAQDGYYKGITRNYLTVYVPSQANIQNQIHNCIIEKIENDKIYAKLI